MNTIYKVIWNVSLGQWTVASEHAKRHGKSKRSLARVLGLAMLASAPLQAAEMNTEEEEVNSSGSRTVRTVPRSSKVPSYAPDFALTDLLPASTGGRAQLSDTYIKMSFSGDSRFYARAVPFAIAIGEASHAEAAGAIAAGQGAVAWGDSGIALGNGAATYGDWNVAIGAGASTGTTEGGIAATAIGSGAYASSESATGLGAGARALSAKSTSLGSSSYAYGWASTAVGSEATTGEANAVAVGFGSNAKSDGSIAVGVRANADGFTAVAVGADSRANGGDAAVFGSNASALGEKSLALGGRALAAQEGAIAIGADSAVSGPNSIALGRAAKIGDHFSTGVGSNSFIHGDNAVVLGYMATAGSASKAANGAVAVGAHSNAAAADAVALGSDAQANGAQSFALGTASRASNEASIAIGNAANAAGIRSAAVGQGAHVEADAEDGIAFGSGASAAGGYGIVAIGLGANGRGNSSVVVGNSALATEINATALGAKAEATALQGTAIGFGAKANAGRSVALGEGSVATDIRTVSVGDASRGLTRRIMNVTDGRAEGDAVTVRQLGVTSQSVAAISETIDDVIRPKLADHETRLDELDASLGQGTYLAVEVANGIAAVSTGEGSLAVGHDAAANGENSVALGSHSRTNEANVVSVGDTAANLQRRVVNVADGIDAQDAVTVGQLTTTQNALAELTLDIGQEVKPMLTAHETLLTQSVQPTLQGHTVAIDELGKRQDEWRHVFSHPQATNSPAASAGLEGDLAFGSGASAVTDTGGVMAVAVGAGSKAEASAAALGFESGAERFASAFGARAKAGLLGTAMGSGTEAAAAASAFGARAIASGLGSVAVGLDARATGNSAFALGSQSVASGEVAVSVGPDTLASGVSSLTIGFKSSAQHESSVALGAFSQTYAKDTISVGSDSFRRRIMNVADGIEDNDAATMGQLKSSALIADDGSALSAVTYNADRSEVSLFGLNGARLMNVADGLIAPGSRDAVNGGQLASLRDRLDDRIAGIDQRVGTLEGDAGTDAMRAVPGAERSGEPSTFAAGENASVPGDNVAAVEKAQEPAATPPVRATPARIENVLAGEAPTDAVNVSQLNAQRDEAISVARSYTDERVDAVRGEVDDLRRDVGSRFQQVDRRIDRMAAMSGAYAGMAMNTAGLDGANRMGVGVGSQRGQKAIAVGYQHVIGKRASFSIGGASGGTDRSVNAGAGFSW